ncbi:MAG: hypothetical protein PUF45_10055 [Lachnospiraceae bacterium]|nr:hypothetical protein [Lachnospiraceae bacterium]
MKKENDLMRQLGDLVKDTKAGKIHWRVNVSTTEYNDPANKPKIQAEGENWTVDECYVSYYCEYHGQEFLMISYEMISQAGSKQKTTNMIFLPPLGIRVFDLSTLMPYSAQASQMLTYSVHNLWLTILETKKAHPELVQLDADERVLTIDDLTQQG